MKWKLYTRNESVTPPVEALDNQEHDTKENALEAAWELMYGPTRQAHMKVTRIEGRTAR
jgi:hypothetical protein